MINGNLCGTMPMRYDPAFFLSGLASLWNDDKNNDGLNNDRSRQVDFIAHDREVLEQIKANYVQSSSQLLKVGKTRNKQAA